MELLILLAEKKCSLKEKPKNSKSNLAVTGLYFLTIKQLNTASYLSLLNEKS